MGEFKVCAGDAVCAYSQSMIPVTCKSASTRILTRKTDEGEQQVRKKLSAAAPAALLDDLLWNAGTTWLTRCQDPAGHPRVAGPPGPSRITS